MRLIHYSQILQGGYCIFNTATASYVDNDGDCDGPGIRISLTQPDEVEKVASAFDSIIGEVEKDPDFDEHYRQILRGESNAWKLVKVRILNSLLELQVSHESLQDELGYALSANIILITNRFKTGFQFTVPHLDDSEPEIINVSFREYTEATYSDLHDTAPCLDETMSCARVVNYANIKERTGTLQRDMRLYHDDVSSDDYRAEITERWM